MHSDSRQPDSWARPAEASCGRPASTTGTPVCSRTSRSRSESACSSGSNLSIPGITPSGGFRSAMSRTRGSARSLQLVTLASIRQASNSCGEAVQETSPRVRKLTRRLSPDCLRPSADRGIFDRAMRAAVFLVLFPIVPLCAQGSEAALREQYEQGEKALADKRYGDAEEAYNKLRQMAPRTA